MAQHIENIKGDATKKIKLAHQKANKKYLAKYKEYRVVAEKDYAIKKKRQASGRANNGPGREELGRCQFALKDHGSE